MKLRKNLAARAFAVFGGAHIASFNSLLMLQRDRYRGLVMLLKDRQCGLMVPLVTPS